jgi:hypothetical protein
MTTKAQPATPLPWTPRMELTLSKEILSDVDNRIFVFHAANAYPRLVKELRAIARDFPTIGADGLDLLRELGEEIK